MTQASGRTAAPAEQPGGTMRDPVRIVRASVAVGVVLFLLEVTVVERNTREYQRVGDEVARLQHLVDRFDYLDEALTMSALMAANTGDTTWHARYAALDRELRPVATDLSTRAERIGQREAVARVGRLVDRLAALEGASLAHSRAGRLAEARRVFASPEYRRYKRDWMLSAAEMRAAMRVHGEAARAELRRLTQLTLALAASGALVLLTIGASAVRFTRRYVERERQHVAALQEGERRFRAVFDSAGDLMTLHDVEGRFLEVNQRTCDALGYTHDELLGMRVDDVESRLTAAESRGLWASMPAGATRGVAGRLRRRDGSEFPVDIRLSRLPLDGGDVFVVSLRDLSERERLEEQLRQAQKMEAVGQLAGGVAHDFNNLLTAILGNAEMLQADLPAGDPRRADVDEIARAASRAAALTRQLLAFGRRQVLQPRALDLNAAVHDLTRLLRRLLGADVEIVTDLAAPAPRVLADPTQLEQVLINLAVNARDAMPQGGTLSIETGHFTCGSARAEPAALRPGRYAVLRVRDTGHGMDEATRERVFEPFFTTKALGKGTGLGLATVYGIVRQSGGSVEVSSTPGVGTEFRVLLPAASDGAPADDGHRPTAGAGVPSGAGGVLLVEDEESVRSVTRRMLTGGGYHVLEASDGEEALGLWRAHAREIDLVLTDLVMPRMGGRELARRLAAAGASVPVVFMSGHSAEDARVADGDEPTPGLGGAFVQKPFAIDDLLRAIAAARGA